MAPNPMDPEQERAWEELRQRFQDVPSMPTTWPSAKLDYGSTFGEQYLLQPRRVRECWRVEDDLMFGAGYSAWLTTGGPEGRA